MKDGFLPIAAVNMRPLKSPMDNAGAIVSLAKKAASKAKIIVFPELSLTGADLRDMFLHSHILSASGEALVKVMEGTKDLDALIFVGLPVVRDGKAYDCVAVLNHGSVIGVVPRHHIPSDVFGRPFAPGEGSCIFWSEAIPGLTLGVAVGEDIRDMDIFDGYKPLIIINPTAIFERAGRMSSSGRGLLEYAALNKCGIVSVNAGPGGASTDGIYAGGSIIADATGELCCAPIYEEKITYSCIDIGALLALRGRDSLFKNPVSKEPERIMFEVKSQESKILPAMSQHPFYPEDAQERADYCRELFNIQKTALMERMSHIGLKKAVLGVSGGLDSTLALLVSKEAIESFGYSPKNLIALTLPGFGTTDRTYDNAVGMIKALGATFREISIVNAVKVHFEDIGQKEGVYDLTFENAQARERTQILMDVAGRENALMVGTGDMSELALGWCTYNGDHMSMYAVNGGLTKTLIRQVVGWYADNCGNKKLAAHLRDVIDTPISPELMPTKGGKSTQKTEDKVGPYELSDFFLYYTLKYGFSRDKILRMAEAAFKGTFTQKEIIKWLDVFFSRFVSQSFKRSCMPDGPSVNELSLSPRGGLMMPSDLKGL